ncbi:hypothetical protein [Phascolarctobacterium sp.]
MNDGTLSVQEQFFKWLSDKASPAQMSELYFTYSEIESFCIERKILEQPLFETKSVQVIASVKSVVDSNKLFRFMHKKKIRKMQSAMQYYYSFVKELRNHEQTLEPIVEASAISIPTPAVIDNQTQVLDKPKVLFDALESYAFTRPETLSYFGEVYAIKNWVQAYVQTLCCLYTDYPEAIKNLSGTNIGGRGRIDIADASTVGKMTAPKELPDGYYLETNLSAMDIAVKIKQLLDLCCVDYENVIITYFSTKSETGSTTRQSIPAVVPQPKPTEDLLPYDRILQEHFAKGYRVESNLDLKRFIRYYNAAYGTDFDVSDEEIRRRTKQNILHIGIRHENYVFSVESVMNSETKERLVSYVERSFSQGKRFIYYKALFEEFNDDFLGQRIYDEDMLRTYLVHECGRDYVFERSFMVQERNVQIDPKDEIKEILIAYGAPMKIDELYGKLPNLPSDRIDWVIHTNKEFVCNTWGEYFHISLIDLSDDELGDIAELIRQIIEESHFVSGNELIHAIRRKYPNMLERFPQFSHLGLRDSIAYYLGDQFSFNGNIISSLHKQLSMSDVFAEFARTHHSFTIDELNMLKTEMNSTIYFDSIYANSLRISQRQFVSKEKADFDVVNTDKAISAFCTGDYLPLAGVTSFGSFPYSGFPWNVYLLEHYVSVYSNEYKLLHISFNAGNCVGAIVRKSSGIDSFNDLITDVLAHSGMDLNKKDALQYLCDMGYLARRRFSYIDQILIKARAKKG